MECVLGCGELPPGVESAIRLMTPEEARARAPPSCFFASFLFSSHAAAPRASALRGGKLRCKRARVCACCAGCHGDRGGEARVRRGPAGRAPVRAARGGLPRTGGRVRGARARRTARLHSTRPSSIHVNSDCAAFRRPPLFPPALRARRPPEKSLLRYPLEPFLHPRAGHRWSSCRSRSR